MQTRSARVIRFIETRCHIPEGPRVGDAFILDQFQKDFLVDLYDNPAVTRRAFLSTAKKNGKSGLAAAILLVHLVGPEAKENSQIVSGALTRDQASILFKYAVKILGKSPKLKPLVRVIPSLKTLVGLPANVEYRALSSEAWSNNGLSPIMAFIDEPGGIRGPTSEFVDAITSAQSAYDAPLLIAIGTQAANDGDMWSIWLDDARTSGDARVVCHLYEAPADCKLDDRAAWVAANPALGSFKMLSDMEVQADEAMRMPSKENVFRNYQLNQRIELNSPFMSKQVWDSCSGEPAESLKGMEVYGGLDLSGRIDLTAFVLIGRKDGIWHVHPFMWTPAETLLARARKDRQPYDVWVKQGVLRTTPGASVDYEVVAREIAEICEGIDVKGVAFDRYRMDQMQKEFDLLGFTVPLIKHGQGFVDMGGALNTVEAEFLNGRVRHGGHPVLTANTTGAVISKNHVGDRRLEKAKSTNRIDGLVAMTMAFGLAGKTIEAVKTPEYQMLFL